MPGISRAEKEKINWHREEENNVCVWLVFFSCPLAVVLFCVDML